jgi:hypothetical protein
MAAAGLTVVGLSAGLYFAGKEDMPPQTQPTAMQQPASAKVVVCDCCACLVAGQLLAVPGWLCAPCRCPRLTVCIVVPRTTLT